MNPFSRSRRSFMQRTAATMTVAAAPTVFCAQPPDSHMASLLELSATEAVGRMSRGEMTVERYASALLDRCEALRALNAFITLEPARVLEAARACDKHRAAGEKSGPLFGLPIPVKDSVNTADYPTTAGTRGLRDFRPAEDAPLVKSLRASGAIVLGKTNLHELSYGWTSNNRAFGAVHNPYDSTRIPGGSSGGTAAAVAARMAPLGVAEDTEGSIRVPAAMCGISGFRPSTGRYPTKGCVPISPLFDQAGPHARNVTDLALFDSVAANDWRPLQATSLRGLRLGVVRDYWFGGLDPEVERLTEEALGRLRGAGAEIIETELPGLQSLIAKTTQQIQSHDVRIALAQFLRDYGAKPTFDQLVAQASPDIQAIFRDSVLPGGADFVSEQEYTAARDVHLPALRRLYGDYFARSGVAAVVFPTTMTPAPLIGEDEIVAIQGKKVSFFTIAGRNIAPGSTTGLPGLVLPAGLTRHGLPVGIEFDGPAGTDRALLALGLNLERALGGIAAAPV
jgi:Asp-tRNA(Asn)/Glu-tRNA(Gln) amidotransferase A subunit family amidase